VFDCIGFDKLSKGIFLHPMILLSSVSKEKMVKLAVMRKFSSELASTTKQPVRQTSALV